MYKPVSRLALLRAPVFALLLTIPGAPNANNCEGQWALELPCPQLSPSNSICSYNLLMTATYSGAADDMSKADYEVLDKLIPTIMSKQTANIIVSSAYAKEKHTKISRLALRRALNIRKYMLKKGVPITMLSIRAIGRHLITSSQCQDGISIYRLEF